MNLQELGEFGLIARWQAALGERPGVRLGIGDDAALLQPLAAPVVTCDCLIEKVHFRLDWTTPLLLGRKAMAVNVSDIAAMGGRPVAAFVSLAVGPRLDTGFLDELYRGLEAGARAYGVTIAGGDTVRSPEPLMLTVTVIGDAPQPLLRSGAQAGDVVLLTGTVGDAAAGLALLEAPTVPVDGATRAYLLSRHHDPTPRLAEIQAALAATAPPSITAAIDISDGLAGDAAHVAERSGLCLEIDVAALPVTPACRAAAHACRRDGLDWALYGGEDYELLVCVDPAAASAVSSAITHATGTPVTAIGRCLAAGDAPVMLVSPNGPRERARSAFSHF